MGQKIGLEDPQQWLEECPKRVFDNWHAAYRLRPFGDEQELLARIASLLILLVSQKMDMTAAMNASNSLMKSLLTSEWIGARDESDEKKSVDSVASFEAIVARAFG